MKPNLFSLVQQDSKGGTSLFLKPSGGVIPRVTDTNRFLGYPPLSSRSAPSLMPRTGTKMKPIQSPFQSLDGNHFDLLQIQYQPNTQNWKFMRTGFTKVADKQTWFANSILEMANRVQADGLPVNPALIESQHAREYKEHQIRQAIANLVK